MRTMVEFFLRRGASLPLAVLLACWTIAVLPGSTSGQETAAKAARTPNIVLIMADDFGYECVAANGGQSYRTPHLDALAASGMRFERCFVQPLCTPTRVQLMTGLSNKRNYVRFGHIDPQATTFAHILKQAGYATAVAGKWQLGNDPGLPKKLGFDESFLWQHTRRPPRYANPGLERDGKELDFTSGEYGPQLVNDYALDFVARHKERPFFLYYPMILTHGPYQPTPDSADWDPAAVGENVNRHPKHFADMVAYADKLVGRLVARLDELSLRENTLVLFLGDNGTGKGTMSKFRGADYPGGKGTSTARGMHVPLIASWPGHVPAGKVSSDLIDSSDFLPTLAAAAGAGLPNKPDGHSFLPQLLGQAGQPREWLYSWYAPDGGGVAKHEFAMSRDYKLYADGRFYDLNADWFEERPQLAGELSAEAAAAKAKLQAAIDQFAETRPASLSEAGPQPKAKAGKKGKGKKGKKNAA